LRFDVVPFLKNGVLWEGIVVTSWRTSVLASRHKALGSSLGDWNGMGTAWDYAQDVNAEHRATRLAAGLWDVSGLKRVHVSGPDAMDVLNHLCTRDLTKVYPGKSVYAVVCAEDGGFTDDCILYHLSPNNWMMVHGSGTAFEQLKKSAQGKQVQYLLDDDLHELSLQGPKALEILTPHVTADLKALKYFHHVPTTLFGRHVLLSRTGYSGERGYEVFAKAADTGFLWDKLLEIGRPQGVLPCSFNCLDMIRVESYLLFYPYDMDESNTLWECGLDFTVSKEKQADFRGKKALWERKGKEKMLIYGLVADTDRSTAAGDEVWADGRKVGKVTGPMYSTLLKKSLAIAQLEPAFAKPGTVLRLKGPKTDCSATAQALPFDDPGKSKRLAA
jgi:aminomethyltransferase